MLKLGTKVDDMFKAWAKADKEAQIEGVKRLGLGKNNTAADRAKAMGFGDDVYHGTKADFDVFKADPDSWSKAYFNSPDPDVAANFGDRIIPLKTRANNIFDYENPKHIDSLIKNNPKIEIGEANGKRFNKLGDGNWASMESDSVQKGIKDLGFDGFNVKEHGVKNTGVYNNTDIRSKFAHFNPKLAGIGGAGAILSTNLMADELDLEHKPKVSAWDSLMNTIGGVNQQQAQAYGDTGAGAFNLAGDIMADPSIVAELGIKGMRGTGLGAILQSNEVQAAEKPDFFQSIQGKKVR